MAKPKIAVTIGKKNYSRMMNENVWKKLEELGDVVHHDGDDPANKQDLLEVLRDADACITSWGVAQLDADIIKNAPNLKILAHMGGSVKQYVSQALWDQGVVVTSAGFTLAEDVAMTTLGIMIVAMKKIWAFSRLTREGGWRDSQHWPTRELRRKTVGIIGAGNVGQNVIRLLQPFNTNTLVYDPYLTSEKAMTLGVTSCSLERLLQESDIVSLHAPNIPATYQMLNATNLSLLKKGAVLINSARGTLIDEIALINELKTGRIEAWLDVTDPEPPALDSPLRTLSNVVLIPHIAGCIEDCSHMGEMAAEEIRRFFEKETQINKIDPKAFSRIA